MRTFFENGLELRQVAAVLFAAFVVFATAAPVMASDDPAVMADTTPTRVLSVVSGGFWETTVEKPEAGEKNADAGTEATETKETDSETAELKETVKQTIRGYYRSIAIRSSDNTSRLFLQRIWLSEDGPTLLDTREIKTLTEMQAYITDMRPENSTGIAKQHGFVTFVYLKKDPAAEEPDTWELYVDQFGDTAFTPATN
ncbi:MAG: hypothetical protein GY789_00775 [Hyphomicrobiales bacterium]|nr:hypothetical protein [Hyphomicrobiales bacterium]MCP5001644.1 hypothetical protein [Hyphomicrobiales bacterium]